jgi:hypothetical protein
MASLTGTSLTLTTDVPVSSIQMTGTTEPCAGSPSRPFERAMQDIAGLAALLCDTPIAVFSLKGAAVRWYRAGTQIEDDACPKHNSFDAYVIQYSGLFEVHVESVDLASLQIRHACLSHSKHLGGLSLRHAALLQPMLQAHQQLRAHFHLGRFFGREKIVKDAAPDGVT